MRRIAEIRHLIAHARLQREPAPIAQFSLEFAFEHIEHVTSVAPVIGEVARRILDHADTKVADVERAPQRFAGNAGMRGRGHPAPVGDGEGQGGDFHAGLSLRAHCHSGAMRSIEPGISRFRVWSFGPSRNEESVARRFLQNLLQRVALHPRDVVLVFQ